MEIKYTAGGVRIFSKGKLINKEKSLARGKKILKHHKFSKVSIKRRTKTKQNVFLINDLDLTIILESYTLL